MGQKNAAMVLYQSRAVINAEDLLRTPVQELDDGALVTAWSVLDLLSKKAIKERIDDLKEAMIDLAKTEGKPGVTSSKMPKWTMAAAGATVSVATIKKKPVYNDEAVRMLLAEKGLPTDRVFKEVVSYELNESALEGLLAAGIISDEDMEMISDVPPEQIRMTVKKSADVLGLLPKDE